MKCKREECGCEPQDNQMDGYCSESCRAGSTDASGACGCGHSDC